MPSHRFHWLLAKEPVQATPQSRGQQGDPLVVHMRRASASLSRRSQSPPVQLQSQYDDDDDDDCEFYRAPKHPVQFPQDTTVTGPKLEPIRSSSSSSGSFKMAGLPPALPPSYSTGPTSSSSTSTIQNLIRSRRSSQDEIRALLARTTQALDKIVSIRESMEDVVDFKQFEHRQLRLSRPSRVSSSIAELGAHSARSTPASSYNSTAASSSLSEDTLAADRSTNSSSPSVGEDHDEEEDEMEDGEHDVDRHREVETNRRERDRQREMELERRGNAARAVHRLSDEGSTSASTVSSISTVDDLAPLKEARLDRLKGINISFHEGLPKEFFQALCRFLHSALEIKTRHSRFNFYKEAFTGGDAVREMLIAGFAEDHQTATRYGNVLVRLGFIEHVSRTDDQLHNSKDNFYRFTKALDYNDASETLTSDTATRGRTSDNASNYLESELSNVSADLVDYDFATATDEVHALVTEEALHALANVLHKVFERKNKLLFYKGFAGCFLGAEAVNVIREMHITTTFIDAVLIGQALLDEGLIEPIATAVTTFQDKYVFYRLTKIPSS
uniref:DEP domain-containing protein n=2 Tax=Peronospora matthiolae TaxID=2874970 RepID=A0AAV1SXQ1_9STRA